MLTAREMDVMRLAAKGNASRQAAARPGAQAADDTGAWPGGKNLFDLRRVAVVHNLHVIARRPDGDYQLAA